MISLIDCGTVMKVACAMQLPLEKSLPREALNGFMILLVDVAIPQSMDVAQQLEFAYHPSSSTKGSILYTAWTKGGVDKGRYAFSESGWMEKESWFIYIFLPAVKHLK